MTDVMTNFYDLKKVKKHCVKYHNPSFDVTQITHPAMMCVCALTGGGKTQFVCNFIEKQADTFTKIYVIHKMDEPLYKFLENELGENIVFFKSLSDLPNPDELTKDPTESILMVFDDMVTEKNSSKINEYFIRGRKVQGGITCCFLTQSYFDTPKLIRKNCHYLILLKIGTKDDAKRILARCAMGVSADDLFEMYKIATKEKFNFLKIDLTTADMSKKFSKNFRTFFEITNA